MNKIFNLLLLTIAIMIGTPVYAVSDCIGVRDGGMPFPLGAKAPLPWEQIDGYWTEWNGSRYFYRMEVSEIFKDGSRNVKVDLTDSSGAVVAATGVGFVRANSWDLWARVKGTGIDYKIRLSAFYPKGSTDMDKRVLVSSIKDMAEPTACLIKHALVKIESLTERTECCE